MGLGLRFCVAEGSFSNYVDFEQEAEFRDSISRSIRRQSFDFFHKRIEFPREQQKRYTTACLFYCK